MTAALHSVGFPGESDAYREARNELLESEIKLRRQIEEIAALRRKLPLGRAIPEDYVFDEGATDPQDALTAWKTRFSELFRPGKDSLVVYSLMYGPEMKSACTSCTSILDGLNGAAPHVNDRINLVVVAKSPWERIRSFARGRGWRNLRCCLPSAILTTTIITGRRLTRSKYLPWACFLGVMGGFMTRTARNCCSRRRSRDRISAM